jgi:transcription elongation factor Elf1
MIIDYDLFVEANYSSECFCGYTGQYLLTDLECSNIWLGDHMISNDGYFIVTHGRFGNGVPNGYVKVADGQYIWRGSIMEMCDIINWDSGFTENSQQIINNAINDITTSSLAGLLIDPAHVEKSKRILLNWGNQPTDTGYFKYDECYICEKERATFPCIKCPINICVTCYIAAFKENRGVTICSICGYKDGVKLNNRSIKVGVANIEKKNQCRVMSNSKLSY